MEEFLTTEQYYKYHAFSTEEKKRYGEECFCVERVFDKETIIASRTYETAGVYININLIDYMTALERTITFNQTKSVDNVFPLKITGFVRIVRNIYQVINNFFFDGCLPSKYCVSIDNAEETHWEINEENKKRKMKINVKRNSHNFKDKAEIGRWIGGIVDEIVHLIQDYIGEEDYIPSIIYAFICCGCKRCIVLSSLGECPHCHHCNNILLCRYPYVKKCIYNE